MPDAATTAAAVEREGPVDAMVALHFGGYPAPVAEMAEAAGLPLTRVIEDAAHALGTSVGDQAVGTVSAATCFSFYATKNLPIGEGGMVTTADPAIAEHVRRARLHGMSRDAWKRYGPGGSWFYSVEEPGFKYNMTDVAAAIGLWQLRKQERFHRRRVEIVEAYSLAFSAEEALEPPVQRPHVEHAWHLYVVRLRPERLRINRDMLIETLKERGVGTSVHFIPLHLHPYWQAQQPGSLPNAEDAFSRCLSLPIYPDLSVDEQQHVIESVEQIVAAHRRRALAIAS
jgi:perosamine synthetase